MLLFFDPLRIQPWSQDKRDQTRMNQITLTSEMQTLKSRTNRAAIGAPVTSDGTGSLRARDVAHVVKTRRHAQNTTTLISSNVAQTDCAAKPAALALPVPKPSEHDNDSAIYDEIFMLLQIKSRASYDHEQQQQHALHFFLAFLFFREVTEEASRGSFAL